MSRSSHARTRSLVAALLVGLVALLSFAGTALAALAPIPEAPTFPVVAKSLTLPFTLEGGGEIEIAVLEAGETPAAANWTVASSLALAPYAGKDIRVLARKAGIADEGEWFDSTYEVRDTFPPAYGNGTPENPDVAVPGPSLTYRGWATGWSDYEPGSNVDNGWKNPGAALGPVNGYNYDNNGKVVVLGDHGKITMTFGSPIIDQPGYDFAVFENGFRISGTTESDFLELGRVEVSSDGTHFARFDSASTQGTDVAAYGGMKASDIGGLAGRDLNGLGTPFDLASLRNRPEVRDGLVDLDDISAVRIVDVVGDGNDLDSLGHPIYDPYPTYGSGGFDLRGVGVFHQRGVGIAEPEVTWKSPSAMSISTSVSPGMKGEQEARIELARETDYANAQVVGSVTVGADDLYQALAAEVNGLFSNQTYAYRIVSVGAGGEETSTPWKSFVKTPASIESSSGSVVERDESGVTASIGTIVNPHTDGPMRVQFEYSPNADHSAAKRIDGGSSPYDEESVYWGALVGELLPATEYYFRPIVTRGNGTKLYGAWETFRTDVEGSAYVLAPPLISPTKAKVAARVDPGTEGDKEVSLTWGTDPNLETDTHTTPWVTVSGTKLAETVVFTLADLESPQTYYYRFSFRNKAGEVSSDWNRPLNTPGLYPTVYEPYVEGTTATGTKVWFSIYPGTYEEQRISLELSTGEGDGDTRTIAVPEGSGNSGSVDVTDLEPGRVYRVRTVTESDDGPRLSSEWVSFATTPLGVALGDPSVGDVAERAATVAATVTPGDFDRSVAVEYGPADATGEPLRSDAQEFAAGADPAVAAFRLDGLVPDSRYRYRVVSTAVGQTEASPWRTFATLAVPAAETLRPDREPSPAPAGAPPASTAPPSPAPTWTSPLRLRIPAVAGLRTLRPGRGVALAVRIEDAAGGGSGAATVCAAGPRWVVGDCAKVAPAAAGTARRVKLHLRVRGDAPRSATGRLRVRVRVDGRVVASRTIDIRVVAKSVRSSA